MPRADDLKLLGAIRCLAESSDSHTHPGRWDSAAGAGDGQLDGLCCPWGCLLVGSEPWWEFSLEACGKTQQVKPMSPVHKCSVSFPCQSLVPHHGLGAADTVPRAATLIPAAPKASAAITVRVLPLVCGACLWESEDPIMPVLVGMREREVDLTSKSLPCPLAPLAALSSRHSMGTAGAARQCCASSKLIGIVTCFTLFVRAPASLRL